MDFYQSLGYLILGSRMRRMSEYFLTEVNRVYQEQEIDFDASWFPLFYILSTEKPKESEGPHQTECPRIEISIKEIANHLQVSHSAVSQLVTNLRKKELVESRESPGDGRVQLIRLTVKGVQLLEQVKPIWKALQQAMEELACSDQHTAPILNTLAALETNFSSISLSQRVHGELEAIPHSTVLDKISY